MHLADKLDEINYNVTIKPCINNSREEKMQTKHLIGINGVSLITGRGDKHSVQA